MAKVIEFERRTILQLAAGLLAASAGLAARAAGVDTPHRLVTTTAHVADLVRAVVGDSMSVESLLGEGSDPHSYSLTRTDTAKLLGADAVFCSGLLLEGKMTEALDRLQAAGRPVVAIGDLVPPDRLLREINGAVDPHIWMDVALWASALPGVVAAVSRLAPTAADTFAAAATAKAAALARLDDYARQVLAGVPAATRILVTAHDAFSYLGRAYAVEVVGIQGISTESEAGLRRIEELVSLLVERRVPAVFVETSVSDRNVRALIEGAAARGHAVVIGGRLFSDALGAPDSYEGSYSGMIDHNVTTIARALGGQPPSGGFQGRLTTAPQRG
jgi:manganese/zinc/iron transport system substrate-binding protein